MWLEPNQTDLIAALGVILINLDKHALSPQPTLPQDLLHALGLANILGWCKTRLVPRRRVALSELKVLDVADLREASGRLRGGVGSAAASVRHVAGGLCGG